MIRSPPNYSQYLAKYDPKRGIAPICTFRPMRSGTQLLCHVPGSHGKTFSKKNAILLLLLQAFSKPSLFLYFSSLFPHPKKEQKCLTISCFPISFVQKSRQKQRVKYRKAKCYRFRNLFGIVASFLWLIFIMRMTGED